MLNTILTIIVLNKNEINWSRFYLNFNSRTNYNCLHWLQVLQVVESLRSPAVFSWSSVMISAWFFESNKTALLFHEILNYAEYFIKGVRFVYSPVEIYFSLRRYLSSLNTYHLKYKILSSCTFMMILYIYKAELGCLLFLSLLPWSKQI